MSRVHEWRNSIVNPGDKLQRPRSSPSKETKRSNPKNVAIAGQVMAQVARPQSAMVQSDKLRPLGRSFDKSVPSNSSTGRGFITVIKSEILQLQRRLDFFQYGTNTDDKVTEVSSDMHDLDQELFGLQYDSDPVTLYKVHATLLEILVDRLRRLARCVSSKARCSAMIGNITSRCSQRPWSAGTQTTASTWAQPQGSGSRAVQHNQQLSSRVEAVLHISELLFGIIDAGNSNKSINDSISNYLPSDTAKASPTTMVAKSDFDQSIPAAQSAPLKHLASQTDPQTAQATSKDDPAIEELLLEKQKLEQRLQATIGSLQDAGRYSVIAYADVDCALLKKLGITVTKKSSFTAQQASSIVAAIRELIELPKDGITDTAADDPPTKAKGAALKQKQPAQESEEDIMREREVAVLAHMHGALTNQNTTLVSLVKLAAQIHQESEEQKDDHRRKSAILQSTVTDLEREISQWSATEIRNEAEHRREIVEKDKKIEELSRNIAVASQPAVRVRRPITIATVKDPPEESDIQKNLKRQIHAHESEAIRQRQLNDCLNIENKNLKLELNSETNKSEALLRELTTCMESNKIGNETIKDLKENLLKSKTEVDKHRETSQTTSNSKTADLDAIRKLRIEISINRNTILKLHEREDQILNEVKEANWKYERIKQTLDEEKKQFVRSRVAVDHEMERLRQAAEVQKKLSSDMRKEASAREGELRNMRDTETRLQNLQRDFKNYTETKIRQGEETEEEEKCMQECLLLLQTELFKLPETSAKEDAELMISQLEDKKRKLEADKRKQEKIPTMKSAKSQIVEILKRRLNAIQLYAFKEKNKTFSLEEEVRALRHTIARCKTEQQHDMLLSKDLAARCQIAQDNAAEERMQNDTLQAKVGELSESIHNKTITVEALQRDIQAQQQELTAAGTKLMDKTAHLRRFGVDSDDEQTQFTTNTTNAGE